jgi:2-keto-4-pentenoate hydratase/2-oxohepta-3-ene-1,7-dioic acid hydratase in catechol pathway
MRIARFISGEDPAYGVVEGDLPEPGPDGGLDLSGLQLAVLSGDPFFQPTQSTGERIPLADVRLLSPIIPRSKVVGVGKNFADHAKEMGGEVPPSPLTFFKPNTAVIGPGDPIRLPAVSDEVSYEAELAVVIGKIAKGVPAEKAREHILGYTCANDVTLRDIQRSDGQWSRAKGFDTSCPLGPWIETELDTRDLAVRSWVNGELRQDGTTEDFVFDIPELIAHISETITLLPGDVILTGTPAGVGRIDAGDQVRVSVEGIGVLANPVMEA